MNEPRTVLLKVYGQADAAPRYDQFRVPAGPRTTVLDALLAVRRGQDPGLTIRHSCLHGSCGTCGMRVNAVRSWPASPDWTAWATWWWSSPWPARRWSGTWWSTWSPSTGGSSRPAGPWSGPASAPARAHPRRGPRGPVLEELERFEDCLECGLCLSACPVAGDPRFLGPVALAAAERVQEEPRGADPRAVLGCRRRPRGLALPRGVRVLGRLPGRGRPGRAIMRLRRRLLRDRLPRLVGRYHREERT